MNMNLFMFMSGGHNGDAKYVWDGDGFNIDSSHGIKEKDLRRIEKDIHEK